MFQIQVETDAEAQDLNPAWGIYKDKFIWTNLSSQIDNSGPAIIVVPLYML